MEKIKVLHVYKDFNVYNGLIEILTIIAQNIDHDKYDFGVCVFRYTKNSFGERFKEMGGRIFSLDVKDRFYKEPVEFIKLWKFLRDYKPDIVQTYALKTNLLGTVAARLEHIPIIIGTEMTLKDIAPSGVRRVRDKLIQPLVSYIIKRCSMFIVTSQFIKEQWIGRKETDNVEVVYPPFNIVKYQQAQVSQHLDRSQKGFQIGFVGRLSEEKGVDFLLRAMRIVVDKFPDIHLTIVGTGPLMKNFIGYTKKLRLAENVRFTGHVSNVFTILKTLDLFVLPSRTEGCPIVILEAMASGLPVIATSVGGNPELVQNGETGILVPFNDEKKLSEAILELYSDQKQAMNMASRGKELAFTAYNPSKFVSRFQDIYERLYTSKILNASR